MKTEISITDQDLFYMSQLIEVIINALDHHHRLTTIIDCQCLILHTLRRHLDLGQLSDLSQYGIICRNRLSFNR